MRVLFMGTPDFAGLILNKLIDEKYNLIGVVTQPDKEKGRGKNLSFSPVKEIAIKNNIFLYQPKRIKEEESINFIKKLQPDIIIVAAFGQILPKDLLEIPRYGCINVHASLLPKYRGAAPIQYAIINGEKETGITIMYMDEGLDTGDIIKSEKLLISDKETGGSLFDKMAILGAQLLVRTLKEIKDGKTNKTKQNDKEASYVKLIKKSDGNIDFSQRAIDIERKVRAYNPWPSAYTYLDGKVLKIWESEVIILGEEYNVKPGTIVKILKDKIVVKTKEDYLAIKKLQLEGKKQMNVEAFLLGYSIKEGKSLTNKK